MGSNSVLATITVGLILIVLSLCGYLGYRYKDNADRADKAEENAQQMQVLTSNVITAVTAFNQISQAATDEKQQNTDASTARVVVIREAVKSDSCATQPVPAAAADSLRNHRNKIRTGAASANSVKPDG